MEQLSLFPAALRVGAYIEEHGRRLAWDELQVGMTVNMTAPRKATSG